jgi:hypothetical protein
MSDLTFTGPKLKSFYVTVAANMPRGSGYYKILAVDEQSARECAFARLPDGRWSFIYPSLDDVHPLDRTYHGTYVAVPAEQPKGAAPKVIDLMQALRESLAKEKTRLDNQADGASDTA